MAPGSDMVLWTVEALKYPSLRGYPDGPASLPPWATPHTGPRKVCPDHNCRHSFLGKTRGYYWFGHKVPQGSWINEYLRGFYFTPRVRGGRGRGRGGGDEENRRMTGASLHSIAWILLVHVWVVFPQSVCLCDSGCVRAGQWVSHLSLLSTPSRVSSLKQQAHK